MPPTIELILFGKDDCSLCDRLEAMLAPHIQAQSGRAKIVVVKRNILDDVQWAAWYRYRIPVLTYQGQAIVEGRPSPEDVSAAIQTAIHLHAAPPVEPVQSPTLYLPARGRPRILFERMHMDVRSLGAAQSAGSYSELDRLLRMEPQEVIDVITASGLRTRDERGEILGHVLDAAREGYEMLTVTIATADGVSAANEELLARDPHRAIEGALIIARAMMATGIEFDVPPSMPRAFDCAEHAIREAHAAGVFGRLDDRSEAGCEVIARQEERVSGAVLTRRVNVETVCNLPWILSRGAEAFAKYGYEKSRGTMVVTLSGDVRAPGLYEVECGTTLRAIINELGEGSPLEADIKVRVGGPRTRALSGDQLDTPLDYEAIAAVGVRLGPASVHVMAGD